MNVIEQSPVSVVITNLKVARRLRRAQADKLLGDATHGSCEGSWLGFRCRLGWNLRITGCGLP